MTAPTPADLEAAGWTAHGETGFGAAIQPFWIRDHGSGPESGPEMAILVEDRHLNSNLGSVHGAVLMALADVGLGIGAARAAGHGRMVTAQLAVQFLATTGPGVLLSCRPEVLRCGRRMIAVRGLLVAEGRTIASAEGLWAVIDPRPAP